MYAGIGIIIVCIIIYMTMPKKTEKFTNPLSGTYIDYLVGQKPPGYFNLKLSTLKNGVLRIVYPKGSGGKDQTATCGISAVAVYPDNLNPKMATLTADVLFEPGFAFDGGKLGLGFEMGSAGATGGHANTTASSCRVIFKKGGSASCYIYVPIGSIQTDTKLMTLAAGNQTYGSEFFEAEFPEGTFKVGVKTKVRIGVKMNSAGKANGECFMSIGNNGDTVTMRKIGIQWLTSNVNQGITRINNTSFIGGIWTSSKDQALQLSNMKLDDVYPSFLPKACGQTEFKYKMPKC
jgi:hypothetical protein